MAFNPVVIEKGLRAGFARAMAEFQAARMINPGIMRGAMRVPSNGAYEKLGWVGAMPAVSQWLGERNAKEFESYDYTVKNLDWQAAVPINENDINDDQTGALQMIPQMLARRIMSHPEKLMFDLLTGGTSGLAYDGVAFFSNASGARTIDNLLAGTGVSLAQLEADLDAALVAMAKFTDDQGEILNIRGDLVVCPVALERKFRRLVQSNTDATASVEGVYNPYRGIDVIGDPRLDAADANDWYLLATSEIVKPLIYQIREEADASMEKKNLTKQWVFGADYRGNGAYGLPHLAVKTVNS